MMLADYYLADDRIILVPIEHLSPRGMSPELAVLLAERRGFGPAWRDLFDHAFALYWQRSSDLARRTPTWLSPRLRHVAIVVEPYAVRPYAQLLNTSAWTVYLSDFDPAASHVELASYLFAHGDRMAQSGEVTLAAAQNAAWWIERSDQECEAFSAAAATARRPDAGVFQAIACALPWLRQLSHEVLRSPVAGGAYRGIPGTGLLVPKALEDEPGTLIDRVAGVSQQTLDAYRATWATPPARAVERLLEWLVGVRPRLLVVERGRIVWDPEHKESVHALQSALARADEVAVEDVRRDLQLIARHSDQFFASLAAPEQLPRPHADSEQRGYSYLHRDRGLIAYDLDEPGMERLRGPALPYARAMLGARTVHEWAHLAVDAGWVPCVGADAEIVAHRRLAIGLAAVIDAQPPTWRRLTAPDLVALGRGAESPADGLARVFCARLPDYRANLLARRYLDAAEIETYVRHNIRTLRHAYAPPQRFRMLIRYLFEYQYLELTSVSDPITFFVGSTWFDADFFATGLLDVERFTELADAGRAICASYAVDESRFTIRGAR